ncbi:hypothetical protein LTR37_012344 [Vermiconidia calcicola]|uniref:Uncharacterized protein n=1 Tax=Vermiconidia calcicola TaxID=1690605 RepID=A0ACC3N0Q9_9PEZI|nr:hypothetical protein LTR37_012344 [Vermiconidia calcicola]
MAYNIKSAVEASSLQAVTELAANPPSHPNTSLEPGTLPLTLYIARVPGSRDVFLTPIKPRDKVVTAEDVQSSLYYVHINTTQDFEDPPPTPPRRPSSVGVDASQLLRTVDEQPRRVLPPLPRRPAPPVSPPYPVNTPLYPVSDGPPLTIARSRSPPKPYQGQQQLRRKPVGFNRPNVSPSRAQPDLDLPPLPRRPLPTPPIDEQPWDDQQSMRDDKLRLLRSSSHLDEHENPSTRDYNSHPETLKQLEHESRPYPGTLTLIRRDPGSSNQWNVASIHDPPVEEVSSSTLLVPTAKRRTKKGGAPVYLDITNEGYSQFISTSRPGTSRTGSESRFSTSSATSSNSDSEPPPEGIFRRRLYMPGSRYSEHGYGSSGHRKHYSVSSASGENELRQTMRNGERHSVDMGAMADRRTKGYTFTSPWDGSCEFTTSATGKSLKCRHRLPPSSQQSGNMVEVSELRFNLPTSSRNNTPTTLATKRSSYFTPGGFRGGGEDESPAPSIVLNDDGRIDLSLGQERAGGGFGGKQAKLGKLIIEPEGVKMLDLLVAANVGLWWRAWERTS